MSDSEAINQALEALVRSAAVVVFGRGDRDHPGDGHTERAISILNAYQVDYEFIDIDSNPDIRRALVSRTRWSVPQVFVRGSLVGGSDALLRLHQEGVLAQKLDG